MNRFEGRRPSILLVDDDDDLRAVLGECLTIDGYDVSALSDGRQAFEFLAKVAEGSQACPDLLIVDLCMPGLSGLGLTKLLSSLPDRPKAILLSGFPDPSLEHLARNAGALRLLRKPVNRAQLREAVILALRSA